MNKDSQVPNPLTSLVALGATQELGNEASAQFFLAYNCVPSATVQFMITYSLVQALKSLSWWKPVNKTTEKQGWELASV